MTALSFEEIVGLVDKMALENQLALLQHLQRSINETPTREILLQKHQHLTENRAFEKSQSLYGAYARPDLDLSFEEIESILDEHSWQEEIDEFHTEP